MKLLLANNHTEKFESFYDQLHGQTDTEFEYAAYDSLLFIFDSKQGLDVINVASGRSLSKYDGVYINGYLSTYELAASVAIACDALNIGYVSQELHNPPSLSKLSMYAKLVAGGVSLPYSIGGTKKALLEAQEHLENMSYPAVLKRADADRGIDNFMVQSAAEIPAMLCDHEARSLWILQEFVPNDGFYLVSFYDSKPVFSIFRSMQERPDGNQQKAHMFKPKGGTNASLLDINDLPPVLLHTSQAAITAMNRQIASVDCLFDEATQKCYVLEVNYNPQLVTIETFKDVRVKAFLEALPRLGA
jgi:hypothetical protein